MQASFETLSAAVTPDESETESASWLSDKDDEEEPLKISTAQLKAGNLSLADLMRGQPSKILSSEELGEGPPRRRQLSRMSRGPLVIMSAELEDFDLSGADWSSIRSMDSLKEWTASMESLALAT
jgi:hypothetical protein